MPVFRFLQEGPNTELSWLLYALLGFMLLAVVVGALTSLPKSGAAPKSAREAEEHPVRSKAAAKVRKPLLKRKPK